MYKILNYLFLMFLIIIIIIMLLMMNYFLTMIKMMNYEKNLPYECGFNPIIKSNLPLSLPYYMITLMFLIFDVEIILILPLIIYLKMLNSFFIFIIMSIFLLSLIFMLILEWSMGYLNWLF